MKITNLIKIIHKCSQLHVLIGRNSSGKSSILDGFDLIKNYDREDNTEGIKDIIFRGIESEQIREILFEIRVELPEEERRGYLWEYFRIPKEFMNTNLLKSVNMIFTISVAGDKVPTANYYNRIILRNMQISDTNNGLLTILRDREYIP